MVSTKTTAVLLAICGCFITTLFSCKTKQNTRTNTIVIDSLGKSEKNPYVTYDQSPMDMSYYPVDYPLLKMNKQDTVELIARIIYSRPHKKNRVIFSNAENSLCQYGKQWRLGANEATEIDFFKNITIAGKNITKGRYVIYCIPQPDRWTIILNTNLDTWGLHIDTTKDVLRTEVPVKHQSPPLEDFTMIFTEAAYGADLLMAWDNVQTTLPITFSK